LSKLVRILLPVSNQGATEACRDAAFRLAIDSGAELEVLHLCAAAWQRLPYSTELSPFYSQELIDIGRDQIVQEQAQAKAWFEQASRVHSCSTARFQTIEGFLTPVVTGRARVADLSVVPSIGEKDDEFWAGIRDAVLFQSGRPALIVPDGASSAFGETVVVAWKDGVEAVHAVAAAAPFFAKAASVSLLSVAESNEDDTSLAAMAEYLTLSGLKVDASRVAAPAGDVAKTLLGEASAKPGALLVMGAYGHWRWREWVFGGVTQEVLRNTTLPVLTAH
jgi:nucleotide-binding universal stress UspA family protein